MYEYNIATNKSQKRGDMDERELLKRGLDECIEMLGRDLVYSHKELCCDFYGYTPEGMIDYGLGMDTKEVPFVWGDETPMEYYAFVTIDPKTGSITREYEKSTLPR